MGWRASPAWWKPIRPRSRARGAPAARIRTGDPRALMLDGQRPLGLSVDEGERPADLLVLKGAEPAGPRPRGRLDPGPDGLNDEHVGEPGDHGLAAGPELPGRGRHQGEDVA